MANQHLTALMHREMSRKEFMGLAALTVGSIFGFSTIIKLLTGKSMHNHKSLNSYSSNGYGK